jgi:hypothetical protein
MWIPLIALMFSVDTYPGWMDEYPFAYVLLGMSCVALFGFYYQLWMKGKENRMPSCSNNKGD